MGGLKFEIYEKLGRKLQILKLFECYRLSLQELSSLPGWHLKERVIGRFNPPTNQGLISFALDSSQYSLKQYITLFANFGGFQIICTELSSSLYLATSMKVPTVQTQVHTVCWRGGGQKKFLF